MILQADSFHIPLKDKSVHMVCTSPPYWGLRDYGLPPSVIGGEADCEHVWGAEMERVQEGGGNTGVPAEWQRPLREAHKGGSAGQFCQYCNAWLGRFGLEPTPELYCQHMVEIFQEVWRVLRDDGTVWLNLGDTYAGGGGTAGHNDNTMNLGRKTATYGAIDSAESRPVRASRRRDGNACVPVRSKRMSRNSGRWGGGNMPASGHLKPKDLCGIPWRVAFALQADGWWLRRDIIWNKNNPMPESVTDRPTTSHEYVFLLTKEPRYFYDGDAIREKQSLNTHSRGKNGTPSMAQPKLVEPGLGIKANHSFAAAMKDLPPDAGRNARSVWTINTRGFKDAHFATFPPELAARCIKAGTSEQGCCPECGAPWVRVVENTGNILMEHGSRKMDIAVNRHIKRESLIVRETKTVGWKPTCDCKHTEETLQPAIVLDPFGGSGTVLDVAQRLGRQAVVLDLKHEYCLMAQKRCYKTQTSLF